MPGAFEERWHDSLWQEPNVIAFFLPIYVFGSWFKMLAVIIVLDFFLKIQSIILRNSQIYEK